MAYLYMYIHVYICVYIHICTCIFVFTSLVSGLRFKLAVRPKSTYFSPAVIQQRPKVPAQDLAILEFLMIAGVFLRGVVMISG